MEGAGKRRVCYFYEPEIGNYYYGQGHEMKPHRIRMAHSLIEGYGLLHRMRVLRPIPASNRDLLRFHADDYIAFLSSATPDRLLDADILRRFNVSDDCPIFYGLFDFCQSYAGASVCAARELNDGRADIAINWSGGLHHAKRSEASGFCYVNDIVLAILKLLEVHKVSAPVLLLTLPSDMLSLVILPISSLGFNIGLWHPFPSPQFLIVSPSFFLLRLLSS